MGESNETALTWAAYNSNSQIENHEINQNSCLSNMSSTVLIVEIIKKNFFYSDRKDMVELLAENGADVNIKNIWGNSALIQAANYGNF